MKNVTISLLVLIGFIFSACQTNTASYNQKITLANYNQKITLANLKAASKIASNSSSRETPNLASYSDKQICEFSTNNGRWREASGTFEKWVREARRRSLNCADGQPSLKVASQIATNSSSRETPNLASYSDKQICEFSTNNGRWREASGTFEKWVREARRRSLNCDIGKKTSSESPEQPVVAQISDETQPTFRKANDSTPPVIEITKAVSNGPQGVIQGQAIDKLGIAELQIDGRLVPVRPDGSFEVSTFVPVGGGSIEIKAINLAGLSSIASLRLDRTSRKKTEIAFERLNPLRRKVAKNPDALALIIGVANYSETAAQAVYADNDAQLFSDYAVEKLGIKPERVKTLINDTADEKGMLLAVKRWLMRVAKSGKSDIYIFFAGHGLASDDGENMYLLPYDGAPELLEDTAIMRDRLFADINNAKPRSVTVFFDTCYSGQSRNTDMLVAARPIFIKAKKKLVPDGFTVFTAAGGDQTAKPLEEAKHGMFSYFLMKGMEGDADSNNDNQITASELHEYVEQNVVQQSGGSQVPELQGDAKRVLVRFQ